MFAEAPVTHYRVVRSWAEEMEAEDQRNGELELVQEGNEESDENEENEELEFVREKADLDDLVRDDKGI